MTAILKYIKQAKTATLKYIKQAKNDSYYEIDGLFNNIYVTKMGSDYVFRLCDQMVGL